MYPAEKKQDSTVYLLLDHIVISAVLSPHALIRSIWALITGLCDIDLLLSLIVARRRPAGGLEA